MSTKAGSLKKKKTPDVGEPGDSGAGVIVQQLSWGQKPLPPLTRPQ